MQLAILCFAVSNRDSWEAVEKWYTEIQRYSDENSKNIVIVGTKDDLESVISDEEVMQFMFDRGMCSGGAGYIRISSKVGTNSELLLHMIGRILLSEFENLELLETFIISPELKSKYSRLVRDSEYEALLKLIKDQQINYYKLAKDNRHIEDKFKQPQEKLNELLNNLKKNPNVSTKEMSLIKNDSDILESYIQDIISGKKVCYYFEGSDEGDYDMTKEKRKTFTKKDGKEERSIRDSIDSEAYGSNPSYDMTKRKILKKEGKEEKSIRDSVDSETYGSNPKSKFRGTRTGKSLQVCLDKIE
jgi:GTPase SAR1 family protein